MGKVLKFKRKVSFSKEKMISANPNVKVKEEEMEIYQEFGKVYADVFVKPHGFYSGAFLLNENTLKIEEMVSLLPRRFFLSQVRAAQEKCWAKDWI